MTDGKDLLESIRQDDKTLAAVHIPAGASHRIRTAIRDHKTSRRDRTRWLLAASSFAVAAAVAIVVLVSKRAAPPVGEVVSASAGCVTKAAGDAVDLTGSCTLSLPTMQIETSGNTIISETAEGVRVLRGTATFQVRPVPAGHAPVRVRVSGGVIEIVGMKFLVEQREGGGSIQLLEGTIRFVFPSGRQSVLHAGERLNWVDDGPAPPSSASRSWVPPEDSIAPQEPRSPFLALPPIANVDRSDPLYGQPLPLREALERFNVVEREARYTEAERLREKLEPASFELGSALEASRADPARVCSHWRWHTKRFPAGIYNGDIEDRMRKLGCQH